MSIWDLSDLCTPWCLQVVVTLRVAEHMAAGQAEIGQLAASSGCDRDSLCRVLRHLVSKGVFEEPERGRFALNETARELLDEGVRLGLDLNGIGGRMAGSWATMLSAVRTGNCAYHEAFGRGFWDDLEAHPEIAASFGALMGPGGHGVPDPEILVDTADWALVRSVVDVGGGNGYLLAEVLRAHPHVRGTLVDLPHTVARSGEVFAGAGVADRVTVVGQSFFDPLPGGADVYVLKSVIGDWPDREAEEILTRCAEAAGTSGRVVVFTGVGEEEEASPELLMMVMVGGKGRTLPEFRELARRAGLEVAAVGRQKSGKGIVECRAVRG